MLDAVDVEAVVVHPPHLHRELVLAALQAGKHVYCEAPLANTVEDARAIALAALAARTVFQGGVQGRPTRFYRHVAQFVKSGVLGTPILVSAQWGRRQLAPGGAHPGARGRAEPATRLGDLAGAAREVGIHALDLVTEYLGGLPVAASGHAAIALWKDARDVADTVQCVLDYPRGVRLTLDATLASSAGGSSALPRQ